MASSTELMGSITRSIRNCQSSLLVPQNGYCFNNGATLTTSCAAPGKDFANLMACSHPASAATQPPEGILMQCSRHLVVQVARAASLQRSNQHSLGYSMLLGTLQL